MRAITSDRLLMTQSGRKNNACILHQGVETRSWGNVLSRVMYLVGAVLASAIAVIAVSAVLAFVLDLSIEFGLVTALLSLGALEMIFATIVFVPVHLIRKRLGGKERFAHIVAGTLIPAMAALFISLAGGVDTSWVAKSLAIAAIAATGAAGAFAFAFVVARADAASASAR